MPDSRSKLEVGVVIWLVALSFWSGVSFMQIQANKEMIQQDMTTKHRMWDAITQIRDEIHLISGYIKAKETK